MLRPAHLGLSIALFVCYPTSYAEAGMYKCTDGIQMTYSNEPCEKLGLSSAGPIKDSVTVVPVAPKPQNDPSEKPGKEHGEGNDVPRNKAPGDGASGEDVSRAATIKPANPLVNKILDY